MKRLETVQRIIIHHSERDLDFPEHIRYRHTQTRGWEDIGYHYLIGNGDCRPLTFGDKAAVRAEVERCMNAGRDCPGYIMCISGHIPPNVPVANALYYDEVFRELRRR